MITNDIIGLIEAVYKQDMKLGDDLYDVTFHSRNLACGASDEQFDVYLQAAADIHAELAGMLTDGRMKREDFGMGKDTPQEEREMLAEKAFLRDGILNTKGIRDAVRKVAEADGIDPDTLYWVLLYQFGMQSVIYATAEAMAWREPGWNAKARAAGGPAMEDDMDWELYFTDYLFRGILFTMNMGHWEAGNKEEKE